MVTQHFVSYLTRFLSLGRDTQASIVISSADYLPGLYNVTIDSTDIYGQMASTRMEIEVAGN